MSGGVYTPPRVNQVDVVRPDPTVLNQLRSVSGLAASVSDLLDARGLQTMTTTSLARPLQRGVVVAGPVITLRYLPERYSVGHLVASGRTGRMGHTALFQHAEPGDIAVIDGSGNTDASLLGGQAAELAKTRGVAGCLISGAVRDVDEIRGHSLPVWSVGRTPKTAQRRLEAVEVNGWVNFCAVQVRPGDIAVADDSGVCFIPSEEFNEIAREILRSGA